MKSDTISAKIVATVLLLVLALPAAASDYTLNIFGNANEDDTINLTFKHVVKNTIGQPN